MRDIRETNWFWIDNALIDREDITAGEMLLYMVLARYVNRNTGYAFPSIDTLKAKTGIKDIRTIVKYANSLEEKGLIEIIKEKGKPNKYYLKNVEEVPTKNDIALNEVPTKNATTPHAKNVGTVVAKNATLTILTKNTNKNNIYTHNKAENSQPIIQGILKKYSELNLPDYEYAPKDYIIMECLQTLGAENLFKALRLMSESDYVQQNLSINPIFKVENLKSALNGNFKNKVTVVKSTAQKSKLKKETAVDKRLRELQEKEAL